MYVKTMRGIYMMCSKWWPLSVNNGRMSMKQFVFQNNLIAKTMCDIRGVWDFC